MRKRRIQFLTMFLGLLALVASGIAQTQLAFNIVEAKLAAGHAHHHHAANAGGHFMPDGTYMAGPMGGQVDSQADGTQAAHTAHPDTPQSGGHTHKGHADCQVCGVVAVMAGLVGPAAIILKLPNDVAQAAPIGTPWALRFSTPRAAYASRAPPRIARA